MAGKKVSDLYGEAFVYMFRAFEPLGCKQFKDRSRKKRVVF